MTGMLGAPGRSAGVAVVGGEVPVVGVDPLLDVLEALHEAGHPVGLQPSHIQLRVTESDVERLEPRLEADLYCLRCNTRSTTNGILGNHHARRPFRSSSRMRSWLLEY